MKYTDWRVYEDLYEEYSLINDYIKELEKVKEELTADNVKESYYFRFEILPMFMVKTSEELKDLNGLNTDEELLELVLGILEDDIDNAQYNMGEKPFHVIEDEFNDLTSKLGSIIELADMFKDIPHTTSTSRISESTYFTFDIEYLDEVAEIITKVRRADIEYYFEDKDELESSFEIRVSYHQAGSKFTPWSGEIDYNTGDISIIFY